MNQGMFECPFCDEPAWRTRYMLWRHMHECIRKTGKIYEPAVGITRDALDVVTVAP